MSSIERMTITMPADMVVVVKAAVDGGDYASTSEVVREALRGNFALGLQAGFNHLTGQSFGLPFGTIPRSVKLSRSLWGR